MQQSRLPACAIFLGSFLLFGVQPMLGRTLLPSFGGTAAVWSVCLAAYQTLLVAGYFYAHVVAKRPLRTQRLLHVSLLVVAAVWTAGFAFGRPMLRAFIGNSGTPALEVLFCVLLFVGLPYVLLSAGSTLVQAWLVGGRGMGVEGGGLKADGGALHVSSSAAGGGGRGVYRLYAVSNLGSFCGLLAYPFILEPFVSLSAQWWGFAVCLAVYAAVLGRVAAGGGASGATPDARGEARPPQPSILNPQPSTLLWFILPCLSVFMLNAVTARLSLDVMALPLLWVVLLGLFLLSYVAGFSERSKRLIGWYETAALASLVVAVLAMQRTGGPVIFMANLVAGIGLVLCGCAFLHSWLYLIRPAGSRLTVFYLANAVGGAVGGVMSALMAPLLFKSVAEYPLALLALLAVSVVYGWFHVSRLSTRVLLPRFVYLPFMAVVLGVMAFQTVFEDTKGRTTLLRERGFYGTVEVAEIPAMAGSGEQGSLVEFVHGSTVHGVQARVVGRERMATAYYTPDAGGLSIHQHPKYKQGRPMQVGLVGTGVGVMLSYCRTNDLYRCYEINEQVVGIATNAAYFTFVRDAPGRVEFKIGDARKCLANEAAANESLFDVLILDALTGDNIPAHLSTREAFHLYFERLAPDGILAVNISNWHLDLLPLIRAVSDAFQMPTVATLVGEDLGTLQFTSCWAYMMRQPPKDFAFPEKARILSLGEAARFRLPTDEKGSFVSLIRW